MDNSFVEYPKDLPQTETAKQLFNEQIFFKRKSVEDAIEYIKFINEKMPDFLQD